MPILLSESDVGQLITMDDLIETMARALAAYSTGSVSQPVRSVAEIGPHRAFLGAMPAFVADPPALGAKLVTVYPGNQARDLPSHLATIALFDPDTGELLALMDGRFITEARTAAVSAVSARLLANPGPAVLAILGAGVQARSHLDALGRVRELREVRVWSPRSERRTRFAREMASRTRAEIRPVASVEDAVRGATVIALVSGATEPILRTDWVEDGAHICAVGACRPTHREMDGALVARSRLFVDSRAAALVEAGDVVLAVQEGRIRPDHIAAEIGEIVAGRAPGRTSPRDLTVFKSLGMAVEDVAAAELAYRRACERGLGRGIAL
jgi:ornithine cyclodeaminase/alanine dehydrogenase-like protein (mu-crystallin family)